LLRLGPEEGDAAELIAWMDCVLKVGLILANPVKPIPGADVTPNNGLGLSVGARDSQDSVSEVLDVSILKIGFLFEVVVTDERG
jgi:hypothetical protein